METIVVQAANAAELKMIEAFLKKNKFKSRVLTDEDKGNKINTPIFIITFIAMKRLVVE